jgi:hypothetical protein
VIALVFEAEILQKESKHRSIGVIQAYVDVNDDMKQQAEELVYVWC